MDSTLGLRERKKAETRQSVHEAAVRLVEEHGLDAVTVEAIADAANISRRTFSNYFDGKEAAILWGEERRFHTLLAEVRAQPPSVPAWQALRTAVQALSARIGPPGGEWATRTRLAKRHPALLARQLANHAALERELALAISEHPGPIQPRVMAAACLSAVRVAVNAWVEEQQTRTLAEVCDEIFEEMGRSFT
jgi:AcrR family transcriptional regulator